MDSTLRQLREKITPKINLAIGNGIATTHIPMAPKYIDQVFRSISRHFPEGLVYSHSERCTPIEEYKETAKERGQRGTPRAIVSKMQRAPKGAFDIAPSYVYMMKYVFRYHDKEFIIPIYLPFVTEGGSIMIAGSKFVISPILSDMVISPTSNNIFAALLCAKLTFRRVLHSFSLSNEARTAPVIWSMIYNKTAEMRKSAPSVKAETTLAHYLFCKYGVQESFRRFANTEIVVGNNDITEEAYPKDKWYICESLGLKPSSRLRIEYFKPNIRIAIKKEEYTPMAEYLLGGLFYIADRFPARMAPDYLHNTRLWRVLMGHLLWSADKQEGILHDKITDHIESIDRYIDVITQEKLRSIGMAVDNIYEFFVQIMLNYNRWLLDDTDKISSMYGKELSVLYYVLEEVTTGIVNAHFALQTAVKHAAKDPKRTFDYDQITKIFKMHIKPGAIYKITRARAGVTPIPVPGDNKAFKMTTLLIPQTNSTKGRRNDHVSDTDPAKFLHVSVAEVGGFLNLQKNDPTGRTRLNVWTHLEDNRVVGHNPIVRELLDNVQNMIRR